MPVHDGSGAGGGDGVAAEVVRSLRAAGLTVGCAESLTAGQVCAALADVPGASEVLRGGVVAYATDVKASVLGVPAEHLQRTGPVDAGVAEAMARGAAALLHADLGVATTGVAGPGPHDGHPAGTVYVAVAAPGGGPSRVRRLALGGDRSAVRAGATAAALQLLRELLP